MKTLQKGLLVTAVVLLAAIGAGAEDIQVGFMGINWGAGISSLEGFSKLYSKNKVDF